jgi:ABC-type multidrug transport system fused ATPase/permease subunit
MTSFESPERPVTAVSGPRLIIIRTGGGTCRPHVQRLAGPPAVGVRVRARRGAGPSFGCVNAVLTAKGLSAGHADRVIFSGVDLVVSPGKVVGLVGANGAGKSTLLRLLAGLGDAVLISAGRDAGSVSLNPSTATVGYLPQEPEAGGGERARVHRAADRGRRRFR